MVVDDYSRFTWVYFLENKDETLDKFRKFFKKKKEMELKIKRIRRDHGGEFEILNFVNFCDEKGIFHEFSNVGTPQQNGIVERKYITVVNISRTMLAENNPPKYF